MVRLRRRLQVGDFQNAGLGFLNVVFGFECKEDSILQDYLYKMAFVFVIFIFIWGRDFGEVSGEWGECGVEFFFYRSFLFLNQFCVGRGREGRRFEGDEIVKF